MILNRKSEDLNIVSVFPRWWCVLFAPSGTLKCFGCGEDWHLIFREKLDLLIRLMKRKPQHRIKNRTQRISNGGKVEAGKSPTKIPVMMWRRGKRRKIAEQGKLDV